MKVPIFIEQVIHVLFLSFENLLQNRINSSCDCLKCVLESQTCHCSSINHSLKQKIEVTSRLTNTLEPPMCSAFLKKYMIVPNELKSLNIEELLAIISQSHLK